MRMGSVALWCGERKCVWTGTDTDTGREMDVDV